MTRRHFFMTLQNSTENQEDKLPNPETFFISPKSTVIFASGGQNPFRKMSLVICH